MTTRDTEPILDCTDIKALLSALLDGDMREPLRHAAERHLAECAACRALLGEAERLEEVLARAGAGEGALPAGFEQNVLARTVGPQAAGARFRSWLGWIAAAATIMLAGTLWVLDRAVGRAGSSRGVVATAYAPGPELRSSIRTVANEGVVQSPLFREATAPRGLPRDSAEAIDSASMIVGMLAGGGEDTFADVDQMRRIAEYEDLLPRLARARGELPASDRPAVWAAESMLYRVVRGPVSVEDLREMRQSATRLELPQRLEALGVRDADPSSL